MKNKNTAFLLALCLTSLTSCGTLTESKPDTLSTAETVYVMTTAQTSLEIAPTETIETTAARTSTTAAATTTTPPATMMTEYSEPVSTHLTQISEENQTGTTLAAATTESTGSRHTTAARYTTVRRTAVNPGTTQQTNSSGKHGTETTTTTVQTETETVTETLPASGETKLINGIIVADYGTDHPRAIEAFSNNHKVSSRYAQVLEDFKSTVGDNINVWSMIVPTSQAFYTPDDVASQYGDQLDEYHNVAEHLDNVIGIPVYNTLESHKEEPLYSRTDYHWQPLAAYYAGEQFAAFAGVPYAPLDTYQAVTREGYVGAFSKVNKITVLEDYPEEFTYYKPANLEQVECTYYSTAFSNPRSGSLFHEDNGISSSYTVFVGTDECILETDTNVDNSRVLVIFKDSYGNALVPFLTQSFSKIYLCDFRYFDTNASEFLDEVGATDVLFAMSTVAVTTSGKVDMVAALSE